MPVINYVEHNGVSHEVDVANGDSAMQGAMDNAIDGVLAECGGGMACATWHCYVDDEWLDRVGPAS